MRLLDGAMQKAGIDREQRQRVAAEFLFDMAMLHDQGGIEVDGVKRMPVLAFAEDGGLRVPNEEFALHDYVDGNVAEFFESGAGD